MTTKTITYYLSRPLSFADLAASAMLNGHNKFRLILVANDAEGRGARVLDKSLTLKSLHKLMEGNPHAVVSDTLVIHPATWTVVLIQSEDVIVRTIPFAVPSGARQPIVASRKAVKSS